MPQNHKILMLEGRIREDVDRFWRDDSSGMVKVVFKKGDGRQFLYGRDKADILEYRRLLSPPLRVSRRSDGVFYHKVLGVYEYAGAKYVAFRVLFEDGTARDYPASYLSVEEHIDDRRSIGVLEYLKEVAQYSVIPIDEETKISLGDKYEHTSFVGKGSLMEFFLNPRTYKEIKSSAGVLIFPFGCNRSQFSAVCNAIENPLSIIQGPPGTGKTQTILNIMANLLLRGKTMQIVSNNNSAVENVLEKLEKEGLGFFVAQLGKSANKKAFIESQIDTYPEELVSWITEDVADVKERISQLHQHLLSEYSANERLAEINQKIEEIDHQRGLFIKEESEAGSVLDVIANRFISNRPRTPEALMYLLVKCEDDFKKRGKLRLKTRYFLWRQGFTFAKRGPEVVDLISSLYYDAMESHLKAERDSYQSKLDGTGDEPNELRRLSMVVFKDSLARRFYSEEPRPVFLEEDIYKHSNDFLKSYPVILSTTFSSTTNISPEVRFDYLIMDEASQVDVAAGALALNCARRAVIVGDLKQLPNVVDSHMEEYSDAVFEKYSIPEKYRFSKNSFLSALCGLLPNVPSVMLREHYRCHPLIIGFCNKQFYDGSLIPMKAVSTSDEFPAIRVVKTVKGNHARGAVNRRQVDVIVNEVLPAVAEVFPDVGVIAPYNAQVSELLHEIRKAGYRDIPVATVHKFQGRENQAIILSTVDNQISEFADDPHLLNVAVSRAKNHFVLVVSGEEQPDSNVRDLVNYIEYWQGGYEHSRIRSVFDLLYSEYTAERIAFLRAHKHVSEYDSENILYGLIEDILVSNGLTHLSVLIGYPLRLLVGWDSVTAESIDVDQEFSKLSKAAREFASQPWAHIDFLVYNTVTHKAVLAIEVDGHSFHSRGYSHASSAQSSRDMLKDQVLAAIGLPLLRLSTTGSEESSKILSALRRDS